MLILVSCSHFRSEKEGVFYNRGMHAGSTSLASDSRRGPSVPSTALSARVANLMSRRFFSVVVTPGEECKVELPPCSALEIKLAALAQPGPITARCTLECDLATHSFVLCSLPPGGPLQATIATVVTNDPDLPAWLFLKARGPRAFHISGRLAVEKEAGAASGSSNGAAAASPGRGKPKKVVSASAKTSPGFSTGDDWPTAADVKPTLSGKRKAKATPAEAAAAAAAIDQAIRMGAKAAKLGKHARVHPAAPVSDEDEDESEGGGGDGLIEVLLPEGDEALGGYSVSDADSEDFVQWMHNRTTTTNKEPPKQQAKQPQRGGRGAGPAAPQQLQNDAPRRGDGRGGAGKKAKR